MKIAVVAWGGSGDVRPLTALEAGLQKAGHTVTLSAPPPWREFAEAAGMHYLPIGVDPETVISAGPMSSSVQSGGGLGVFRSIIKTMPSYVHQWMESAGLAAQDADLLLSGFLPGFFVGHSVEEASGARFVPCLVTPFTPTREMPSMAWFPGTNLGGFLNHLSYPAFLQMMWIPFRTAVNRARRDWAGLSEVRENPFLRHLNHDDPTLYGFSRYVFPHPADWPGSHRITGYWSTGIPAGWEPPESLVRFLDQGTPPVCFGFGSMSATDPETAIGIAVEAIQKAGKRGILLTGWGRTHPPSLPDSIWCGEFVPHTWLLQRCAAVIHHGGAGTTGAAFQSGIPQIVVPHNFDQFFWARRVHVLGAGPKPFPRSRLTVSRLVSAIQQATGNEHIKTAAKILAEKTKTEAGIPEAIQYLESIEPRRSRGVAQPVTH